MNIQPTWQSDCGQVQLFLGDCREVLPCLGKVDCVIADPPYGIAHIKGTGGKGAHNKRNCQKIAGDDVDFDPAHLLGFENVLLWGADHYSTRLPHGRWLAWNKLNLIESFDSFSDVEFAWHSKRGASRIFNHMWKGIIQDSQKGEKRLHPMTKPVALMNWCIVQAGVLECGTVCDPYMGTCATGIATIRAGRKFIGVEIEPEYFQISQARIQRELAQLKLNL